MTADRYATRFSRMFELPMTSFRYCQSPPIGFDHPSHVTYLHVTTISQEKKSVPDSASRIIMRFWQPNASTLRGASIASVPLQRVVMRHSSRWFPILCFGIHCGRWRGSARTPASYHQATSVYDSVPTRPNRDGREFQSRLSLNSSIALVRPMRTRSASESTVLSNHAAADAISS